MSFRFTDILRGLVAQPILWQHGYKLGFVGATVTQERNPHDYIEDLKAELECYLSSEKIIEIVNRSLRSNASVSDNLYDAYNLLVGAGIVPGDEMTVLEHWLSDLSCLKVNAQAEHLLDFEPNASTNSIGHLQMQGSYQG